jgi:uncharacterized protein involved in exopolysaccharide biosynthesis
VLRHPFLTLLPVVVLVGVAIFLGSSRDAEYTATARVTVGRADLPPFYLQQAMSGNQALAASYATAVDALPVATAAAQQVGVPPTDAADSLSGSQVAGSTLIEVEATGTSSNRAVALANAGSEALIDYIADISETDESRDLFRRYREAQVEVRRAQARVQRILRGGTTKAEERKLAQAQLTEDSAQLRASDLANRYRAISLDGSTASRLRLIAPAAEADSDRRDVMEQLLVVGAVGGLVLGLALALLRSNWGLLRTLRRA